MKSFFLTDVGQVRSQNQDYVYASEQPIGNLPNLFVLADGMGGHNAGDFASRCAVSVIEASVKKDMSFNPIKIMRHAIEEANEKIHELAKEDAAKAGMGTTLVAVTVVGYYAYVANVGDSRLYVVQEQIHQVTKDHSLVQEMVRMGEIKPEEARNHPDKNIITRALGAERTVDIDFFDLKLEPDSTILMCSDGLSNMVEDSKIEQIILDQTENLSEKGERLLKEANQNGGKDNIAVILVEPFTNEVEKC